MCQPPGSQLTIRLMADLPPAYSSNSFVLGEQSLYTPPLRIWSWFRFSLNPLQFQPLFPWFAHDKNEHSLPGAFPSALDGIVNFAEMLEVSLK